MEEQVQKAYDLIEYGNYWRAEFIADRLIKSKAEDKALSYLKKALEYGYSIHYDDEVEQLIEKISAIS